MIGSFLTRGLVMVFGYAYPAYECYKTVEKNKVDIEQLRFWCQYWILVAFLTVFERVGDAFISWVPMYSEAKLLFFIFLWYPKTKGTTYVYESFFLPYLSKYEIDIDRNLLELKTRAGDLVFSYCQKAVTYGQTRVFEILHYVSAHATPRPSPTQRQQLQGNDQAPPTIQTHQPASKAEKQLQQRPSRSSSTGATQQHPKEAQEAAPPAGTPTRMTLADQLAKEARKETVQNDEAKEMQIEPMPSSSHGNANPPPKETILEDTIRVTRAMLRRTQSAATNRQTQCK